MTQFSDTYIRADSRFVSSQWETALLCNEVSHWLGINLESALYMHHQASTHYKQYDIAYGQMKVYHKGIVHMIIIHAKLWDVITNLYSDFTVDLLHNATILWNFLNNTVYYNAALYIDKCSIYTILSTDKYTPNPMCGL